MTRTAQAVFIIEDDESVRKALGRLLRSVGLDVAMFATAEDFMQAPLQPSPGCLILDVHLPGMSGLDLQKRLSAEGRDIPIVFITAYVDDQAREQALQAGALAFLQKPFDEQALLKAVNEALG